MIGKKVKLLNKTHGASLNFDHLAHMNVMEIAFIKNLLALHTDSNCIQYRRQKSDLRAIGVMLDLHLQWMEKEYLFYDWMVYFVIYFITIRI